MEEQAEHSRRVRVQDKFFRSEQKVSESLEENGAYKEENDIQLKKNVLHD